MKARTVEDVILGEATYGTPEERFRDMLAIASVIDNRARQLGVTPEEVVAAPGQFSAYNRALPAGVDRYRSLAKSALDMVKTNGPVHRATFYATPDAAGNLPSGLAQVGQTTGHIYFDDPANRPIRTSVGFRVPQAITAEYSPPYEMAATTGAFSPSMVPSANAGPAGRAYGDLVPPTQVETTSQPATFSTPTYNPDRQQAAIDYSPLSAGGVQRNQRPDESFMGAIGDAVAGYFGPGYSVSVASGKGVMRNPDGSVSRRGNHNHPSGFAADFDVIGPDGQKVGPARMADFGAYAASKGFTGVGVGPGYMEPGRMHLDKVHRNPTAWGAGGSSANMDPALHEAITQAGAFGAPLFGAGLPENVPTPTASPGGLGAANYAAPVSAARSAVPSQSVSRSQQTWERIAPTTPEMMQSAGLLSNPGFRPDITAPQGLGATQMAGGLGAPSPERFARTTTETLPSGGTLAFRPDIGPSQAEIGDIAAAYAASSPSVAKSKAAFDAMRPGPNNAQPGQFDNMLAGMAGLGAPATAVSASPADIAGIGTALDTTRGVIGGLGLEPGGTIYSLADAVNSPTIAAPDQYPPAPADDQPSSLSKAMKRAAIGGLLGGLPGAALGLASGMFGNELGGLGIDSFGDAKYGPAGDAERFSVGSGVRGVEAAMSGARGATARASNGSTITSRGRGLGYDLTNQFGARTTYDANGKAMGNRNTLDRLGGLFGGLFGGGSDRTKGEFSKAERDKYSGGKGLF